jgi:hypothetical protein
MVFAFIAGVAVGIRYMYNKYNQQMLNNLKTLEELKLGDAKIRGMLDALKTVNGIDDTTPLRVAYVCDREFCEECNNPDCNHCFDIRHAKNFEYIAENEYWEKEVKNEDA